MSYIYLDESGDLGFRGKGSDYFIITCIKIDSEKVNEELKRIPKKIRQKLLKKKYKKLRELKFSNSSDRIRNEFLLKASKLDFEIYSLIIDKKNTNSELKINLPILYNYLIKILLESPLKKIKSNLKLHICLDRCMSASQRENFENYVKTEFLSIFERLPEVEITHELSDNNGCLQVLDFICGAFGYKYNTMKLQEGSDIYLRKISSKIIIERNDLFKPKDISTNPT